MANTVKLKRSATPSAVPTTGQLDLGEIAINTYDGKMYIKKDNGAESVVEIGGGSAGASALDDLTDVTISSPASGQVLSYNGSGWVNAASAAGGSVYYKDPVRVATTANGTLASSFENGDVIDGVTLATGDRILIKNQTTTSENGIYVVNASGAPTRASDMDANSEAQRGVVVYVQFGNVNGGSNWQIMSSNGTPIVVGTSTIVWGPVGGVMATAFNSWTAPAITEGAGTNLAIGSGTAVSGTVGAGNSAIVIGDRVTTSSFRNIGVGQRLTISGGDNVVLGGNRNSTTTVSGSSNVVIGNGGFAYGNSSTVSSNNNVIIGGGSSSMNLSGGDQVFIRGGPNTTVSSPGTVSLGASTSGGSLETAGEFLMAGRASPGTKSTSLIPMGGFTTSTTPTELGAHNGSGFFVMPNKSMWIMEVTVVAKRNDASNTCAAWKFTACYTRNASAATTELKGTLSKTVLFQDSGATSWDATMDADTTNGRPRIMVTGEATNRIEWYATCFLTKQVYS